ncbi:MAG: hypothetical protein GY783_05620 [Gammaproteobacteria bacterium]|nr:hypothetical protein [Gammaproteobacteria bacterium]
MPEGKYRSEAEWLTLIAEQSDSGQSALDFCRDHGLYAKTFYRQRKALRKKGLIAADNAFVQVKPKSVPMKTPSIRLELQFQRSRLQLSPDTDPRWLAELMKALP